MKDYYDILGVPRTASDDDIKKAFRKLAHQYHPDKNGGDDKKFKEINEAYQALSNKEKRAQYDRFGKTFDQQGGFGGAQGGPFGAGAGGGNPFGFDFNGFSQGQGADFGDLDDILGAFFGGGRGATQASTKRGSDVQVVLEIPLKEVYTGTTKNISFESLISCDTCKGIGYDKAAGVKKCDVCKGSGKIKEQHASFFGTFTQTRECSTCLGTGEIPKKPCATCHGTGRVEGQRHASVHIKEGVRDGQVIKLQAEGEAGLRGHEAGDLYVRIKIPLHPHFRVEGDNLITTKKVSFADILRGEALRLEHISGRSISFDIPPHFNVRGSVVIKGEGMPHSGFSLGSHKKGDLIIELELQTPKKMNEKAKKLARELADELEKDEK